jgi:hypothetical protein
MMQRRLGSGLYHPHIGQLPPLNGAFCRFQALVGNLQSDDTGGGILTRQMQQKRAITEANFDDQRALNTEYI